MVSASSRRFGSGRRNLPEIRNWSGALPVVGKWSRLTHGGPEVVETPFRRSGSGRETLPEVWKWSAVPPGGPEVVGRPSRSP